MNKLKAFMGWYIENAPYQVSEPDPSIVSHRAWLAGYAQAEADAAEKVMSDAS